MKSKLKGDQMKYLIILIILLISLSTAQAEYVTTFGSDSITNKLVGGSIYETNTKFSCSNTVLSINLTVEHPLINTDEWFVKMYLDEVEINCIETEAGVFNSTFNVIAGSHDFVVRFKALPNILPGEYVVTIYYPDTIITTWGEGDAEEEEENNYAHRLWREKWKTPSPTSTTHLSEGNDTTATPTPTPVPTETQEPTFIEPLPTEEDKYPFGWLILTAIFLLTLIITLLMVVLYMKGYRLSL